MVIEEVQMTPNRRDFFKIVPAGLVCGRLLIAPSLSLMASEARAQLKTPAIFYAPHQDDEAIGMAGSIAEHKDAGRPVFLVLISNGINTQLLSSLNDRLDNEGRPRVSMEQMMWGRRSEFSASGQSLGVDKLFIVNLAQGFDDTRPYPYPSQNYDGFVQDVSQLMQMFETRYPGSSHKIAANDDCTGCTPIEPNPTHRACYDAGQTLKASGKDVMFFRIYEYFKPIGQRSAQFVLTLTPSWMSRKQTALDQYKLWDPSAGRYGLGYMSVPGLIDAAYSDNREFFQL